MARACRRWRGGILGLFEILANHGYAVEADLRRYYGVDLVDFWRDEITPRQILVYISHLPADSATAALIRDKPELQDWGLTEFLLGGLTDRIGQLVYMYAYQHTDERERRKLQLPESVLPDSAVEKVVREETAQMSVSEFFSPADIFAEIAIKPTA